MTALTGCLNGTTPAPNSDRRTGGGCPPPSIRYICLRRSLSAELQSIAAKLSRERTRTATERKSLSFFAQLSGEVGTREERGDSAAAFIGEKRRQRKTSG